MQSIRTMAGIELCALTVITHHQVYIHQKKYHIFPNLTCHQSNRRWHTPVTVTIIHICWHVRVTSQNFEMELSFEKNSVFFFYLSNVNKWKTAHLGKLLQDCPLVIQPLFFLFQQKKKQQSKKSTVIFKHTLKCFYEVKCIDRVPVYERKLLRLASHPPFRVGAPLSRRCSLPEHESFPLPL